ncbi:PREDICTED: histone-lysine N-methyltransferase SETMAR-like [Atta cephalotes]|uniref:Tc1-like transposase DDE domain-containing protein n=1 Tax=Atta cephalotes TaxID=12957 RepID=A0A158NW24_ATTCE|nr:PREDICTED: histone-lysine N-methyltransferase SETMAR-like [Atta cephalotes]
MRRFLKLPDTGYRISGQNVTSNIQYPVGYRRRQFLQVGYPTFSGYAIGFRLVFVKKLDVWVPHELKEIHLTNRMNVCDQLIKREENDPFLKRMITGDEKWIVYNNVSRKRSWSKRNKAPERHAKAEIHQKLQKLSDAIAQKRPELISRGGVVFHHDNARPHTSLITRQKLQHGWNVLPHPPYSPDLTPSDFHLFRSLQNSLKRLKISSNST